MSRRHAISPGFFGHYQDLGISRLKGHDSDCKRIRGYGLRLVRKRTRELWRRGARFPQVVVVKLQAVLGMHLSSALQVRVLHCLAQDRLVSTWHGMAHIPVFLSQKPSTKNGKFGLQSYA